jgi:hypothetical protein
MTGEALQSTVLHVDGCDNVPTSQPKDQSVFVPAVAHYPRWFVQTERFPGDIFSTFLMVVFIQEAPKQSFKAALLYISPGTDQFEALGEVARDSHGYASAVPLADSALAIAPDQLPASWTSLYNSGVAAAKNSRLIQPNGIEYFRALQDADVRNGPKHGFAESARETAGSLPVYAFARTGGGALVIFTSTNTVDYRATRTATITFNIDLSSGIPEPPWDFQQNFAVPAGTRMSQVDTFELVAIDPARGEGPVDVIDSDQDQTAFSPATEYAATHGQ